MRTHHKPMFKDIRIVLEEEPVMSSDLLPALPAVKKDIAIIGIAGNLPEAKTIGEFWNNIVDGRDSVRRIPLSRQQDYEQMVSALLGRNIAKQPMDYAESGYLQHIDWFDHEYFSISPKEAKFMDPNQRIFLQCCLEAMEDAGYGDKCKGSRTGVFLGHSSDFGSEYKNYLYAGQPEIADLAMTGNIRSIIAARIAYLFDLRGPSMVIDTACSSSLVAIHLACQSIRRGECEMALAGGVKVQLQPFERSNTEIGIVSPTFRARTFDSSADGTGMGEGAGVVMLKDLASAVHDGDQIYAVIKGSAVNQDGHSNGITAPSSRAQEELLLRAWQDAGIHPETITMMEAHGTATPLGDPVEIEGIRRAFAKYTVKKQFCAVGSIKTNIGHLDHAAGIAGLLKCILALKHQTLPPTLHFSDPNSAIDFIGSPVYVNSQAREWDNTSGLRRCGINSFGLSGTNCHVVLEEYLEPERVGSGSQDNGNILTMSAKNKESLQRLIADFAFFVSQQNGICTENMCYSANTGREAHAYRIAIVFDRIQTLMEQLHAVQRSGLDKITAPHVYYSGSDETAALSENVKHRVQNVTPENEFSSLEGCRELALTYIRGGNIPWHVVYEGRRYERISLPVYPFQEKRCWIDPSQHIPKLGPLVDKLLARTKDMDVYETWLSVEQHWELAEHRVLGHCILPGTAYLEMIHSIIRKRFPEKSVVTLENVFFQHPLQLAAGMRKQLHIQLLIHKDSLEAVITSPSDSTEEWVVHCKATVAIHERKAAESRKMELSELLKESGKQVVAGLKPGADAPVQTGPRWECMKELYQNGEYITALMELPPRFGSEVLSYGLHPSLLDCAVNIPISRIRDGLFLPFTYRKATFAGSLPSRLYTVLHIKDADTAAVQETVSFDITFITENGDIIAEIEEYTLKRVHTEQQITSDSASSLFHRIEWKTRPLLDETQIAGHLPGMTLIFAGSDDISDRLVEHLAHDNARLITVHAGSQFSQLENNRYCISGTEEDYDTLLRELDGQSIDRIIYGFPLGNRTTLCAENRMDHQHWSLFGLFYLTKALVAKSFREDLDLVLIGYKGVPIMGDEPFINPIHNAFYHLGKVISSEYPQLKCRAIDLDEGTDIVVLMDELQHMPDSYTIGYRQGARYAPSLCAAEVPTSAHNTLDLHSSGCYVITGGTGGLGLVMAEALSRQQPVHLVLISRSGLPDESVWERIIHSGKQTELARKIALVRAIRSGGSTCTIYKADVADQEQLESVLQDVRKRFGFVRGVIHAAGVAGDQFLFHKDQQRFAEVVRPKIDGSLVLAQLISEPLDFFVCFSSVSSLEGTPGQGDYVAANGFLDSFVYTLPAEQHGITINWAPWNETGMAVDYGAIHQHPVFVPLSNVEAITAFKTALAGNDKQLIIGRLQSETARERTHHAFYYPLNNMILNYIEENSVLQSYNEPQEKQPPQGLTADVPGSATFTTPAEISMLLRQLWTNLLESEAIGLEDTFTSHGGNSIFAVYLLQKLEPFFPGKLSISDIFTYSTIQKMADYLYSLTAIEQTAVGKDEALTPDHEDQILDRVLQRLADGELDVEEIDRLLGEE